MNSGIVVVGTGHAGFNAAAALRAEQYDGTITLLGEESVRPYHRPPLSKTYIKGETPDERLWLRPENFYADKDITLKLAGQVSRLSPRDKFVELESGDTFPYDKLVLATGSRARQLDVPGIGQEGVELLRTLTDARRIKAGLTDGEDVVVIGGGFIGLEFAAAARSMGKNVTVLEAYSRILGRSVAPLTSDYVLGVHRSSGIDIVLNAKISRIDGDNNRVTSVSCEDGSSYPADLVIVGVGVVCNDELASEAGLACDNGVVVDKQLRSSDDDIFCIGDCAAHENPFAENRRLRLESIQNATDQGRTVAKVLTGNNVSFESVPWFWSDQGGMKLQMVGLSFDPTDFVVRGEPEQGRFSIFHYREDKLIAIDTINDPAEHMMGRSLIGSGISPGPSVIRDTSISLKTLVS